tara:strand:+ start:631 stop:810 length:180 start_codon:yes stop_codon:yes gene_type:complete
MMGYKVDLDGLKRDLTDLADDMLAPPEKLESADLMIDRLELHKKLKSIIDERLDFKFNH